MIKEFGPELKYIKVKKNISVKALYRLEFTPNTTELNIAECFGYDDEDLPPLFYPIWYYYIYKDRNKDPDLLSKLISHKDYEFITFCGGDKPMN